MKHDLVQSLSVSLLFIGALFLMITSAVFAQTEGGKDVVDYVNPFIGTGGHGHTYPGATVPFGMVELSPDAGQRGWDWCSGYHYSDTVLVGFSHTHLSGTGCADLGDILVTPMIGMPTTNELCPQRFSHNTESAAPGFYAVNFPDAKIHVELTATARAGLHRYSFPASDSSCIVFDLGYGNDDTPVETHTKIIGDHALQGYRFSSGWARDQKVYFYAEFSQPSKRALVSTNGAPFRGGEVATARTLKVAFLFDHEKPIFLKVGLSPVSIDGARNNLLAEIPDWDFDRVKSTARAAWQKELSKIVVSGGSADDLTTFYTAYYHALLAPTLFCDVDGAYRGPDGGIHSAKGFDNYCTFSLWDTYRAAHPLYTIVQPSRVPDFVNSMIAFQQQHGVLPVWPLAGCETWCMIGYHAVPVIADAFLKGFRGFDARAAYQAMKASALDDRRGLAFYNRVLPQPLAAKLAVLHSHDIATSEYSRDRLAKSPVLQGYTSTVSGETIHYHSSYPYVNDALVTRATDGKTAIEWETQTVPQDWKEESVTFMWVAGHATGKGGHRFDLFADGERWMSFTAARDTARRAWSERAANGATLTFLPAQADVFDDLFGEMFLTVPAKYLEKGKSLRLKVVGESGDSPDWYMTFQHAPEDTLRIEPEYALAREDNTDYQVLRAYFEYTGAPAVAQLQWGSQPAKTFSVYPGLNVVDLPTPAVHRQQIEHLTMTVGRVTRTREVVIRPVVPFHYVPADRVRESVSKTLEYAYDDWCIAQTANALGESSDYAYFSERADYWRNLYDVQTGFMRGRNSDGSWVTPFDPRFSTEKQPEYTEGNAWQYSWYVPQDVAGLINVRGGPAAFCAKLDELFNQSSKVEDTGAPPDVTGLIGLYAHGNEPSHHIAYLYDQAGQAWKTQQLVHRILHEFYSGTPDGLCGNEDCGQMSAWYIFSALGFYPVNPANGTYQIGSPLFPRAQIDVGDGKTFTVEADNVSDHNIYIQSASLNGVPLKMPSISHRDIMSGGTLHLEMGSSPDSTWNGSR